VVRYVNELLHLAVEGDTSDIHIEPLRDRLRIRMRRDGSLQHHEDLPLEMAPMITSRIKVMAKADITEKRRHQGGRILLSGNGTQSQVDVRCSFYVTVFGEKIVLRILNKKEKLLDLTELGFGPILLERYKLDALDLPTGVVIITGPTGSGKTTTLYSSIHHCNDPSMSIVTVEDPVEYVIDGVSQCSIDPKIGLTFEESLKQIVRQDPDIIVLGEIRDKFSAETAIQAALTGHKVFTTFHTEDSIGGLLRLMNMDIETFLISSTVICVVAQRLLKRICRHCCTTRRPDVAELRRLGYRPDEVRSFTFCKGQGCSSCGYTGYKGRIGIFELLVLNEQVKQAILDKKTSSQIRKISTETSGLVTLTEEGIAKVVSGLTTISEVVKNLPRATKPRPIREILQLTGVRPL
jgi:type IV pilus assembly protein PilB